MTPTNTSPILRNSTLVLPVAALGAAVLSWDHAAGAAASGALMLANLWALSVLGPRLVVAIARDEPVGLWVAALVAKFALVAVALVLLAKIVPPIAIAIGFVPLLAGTLITALQLAQQPFLGEA